MKVKGSAGALKDMTNSERSSETGETVLENRMNFKRSSRGIVH